MATDGPFSFEVSFERLQSDVDEYVERVFRALESDFLVMPRGEGFVAFDAFVKGYYAIHAATEGFERIDADNLFEAVCRAPIGLVVLRTILGLSPPEWSDVTTLTSGVTIGQGFARNLDRGIRKNPESKIGLTPLQDARIRALVRTACELLTKPAPATDDDRIHRLDKVDTSLGQESLVGVASVGVDYPSLLYERFLGRPFASHRDSVSELVGGALEDKVERELIDAEVPYFRTKRAESLEGWQQNPDFFCPSSEIRSP